MNNVTALVLTANEEANIGRVIDKLGWVREVVIVDSGSTDRTCEIVRAAPNARIVTRTFDNHAAQWNFGLGETGIGSEWVLALDADYVLTDDLVAEFQSLDPAPDVAGYRTRFRYRVLGRVLSRSMYPPGVTLYRRRLARYVQDGHTQRVVVDGRIVDLHGVIDHDDRKPLARWLVAQDRYAQLECEHLRNEGWGALRWQDRLRKAIVIAPWLVPVYCMTVGLGFKDGLAGLHYAFQRAIAEALLSLKLIEAMIAKPRAATHAADERRDQ